MLALADALPDRVTAGWNQFLCTALAGDRPAHGRAVGLAVDLHARRPGRDAGRRRLRRARLHRARPARCARPTWRCSSSRRRTSWSTTSTCPTRPGAGEWRGGLGTRSSWRFYGERRARRRRSATTSRPRAPTRRPGLFGGEPAGLNELRLHFPDGTDARLGLEGDRPRHPRRARSARRATAAAAATATRAGATPQMVLRGGARRAALAPRRRARATASPSCDGRRGRSTRPRRRGCAERAMSYRIGIDVGGTFTDFLVLGGDGPRLVHKTSSTPDDPSRRPRHRPRGDRGAARTLDARGVPRRDRADRARHDRHHERGAHPPRRAAPGCSCTEGFRDALALRDGHARGAVRQPAAAARAARPALPARSASRSASTTRATRSTPLDERRRARRLPSASAREGVEAVAISFMHSPTEPRARAPRARPLPRAAARRLRDGVERPAAAGALLRPHLDDRAERLRRADHHALPGGARRARLDELGFGGVLLIMQSNGGVATPAEVVRARRALAALGPGLGPDRRALAARAARRRATASRSTWAAPASTRRS